MILQYCNIVDCEVRDQVEELLAHFRARANANDFRLFLLENCEEAAAQGR